MTDATNDLVSGVIEKIQQVISTEGYSYARIAEETGRSKGAINQFVTGKYPGDVQTLASILKQWLDGRESRQRIQSVLPKSPGFLHLPSAQEFLAVFEYSQMAGDIGIITGAPGTGKTFSAEYYRDSHPNIFLITADSSLRSPSAILRELAELIDIPSRGYRLITALVRRLKNTGGLIIVDEAHHLTTEALDLLRAINDRAGIGIVWVGNEPLRGRIEGLGRQKSHAQIYSRVGMWRAKSKPMAGDILQFLDSWSLTESAIRKSLRWIGNREGGLREINKTLRYAHILAGSAGRETVTLRDIEQSWAERRGTELPKRELGDG